MAGKTMYASRYRNMIRACKFVLYNPDCGNTAIANEIKVSRQAVNRIMKDAVNRGWIVYREIDWRPNVKAKRYSIGRFFPYSKDSFTQS